MVMASKQAQLMNLCSNLSAAHVWLYFCLTKCTPSWRVWWEDCVNKAALFQSMGRKLLLVGLFSDHLILLIEVYVFIRFFRVLGVV